MKKEQKLEISQERIIGAAIGLLNREGLEKLTMRALAGTLGIKAASLYWHIRDKQALIDQIAESISSEIRPSCGLKDPKAYLMEAARLYRKKLLEFRDSVEVFMRSPPSTPVRLELIRNILICLLHLDIKEENCAIAAHLFNNYVLSFSADEALTRTKAPENAADSSPKDKSAFFDVILGTAYKPLTRDEAFNLGLDVLFAGFKILE